MGAYCLLPLIPSHPARVGEIMKVLWSKYHGAVIFGDRREIACIPHTGCRLEIVATPRVSHRKVNLQLAPSPTSPPLEDLVVRRQRLSELESSRRS
jgi:hypothetical protein